MPPKITMSKSAKRTGNELDLETTPSKRKKPTNEDSEEITVSITERVSQLILPSRNKWESCDKHAHPPWPLEEDGFTFHGCMHKCEICGDVLPRNLMRHVKTNHCYDPSGQTKTLPEAADGKSVVWDVNKVFGPKKGGQKVFVLDTSDQDILIRAAQITTAETADDHHMLNATWMNKVNKITMNFPVNPVTGKPGSAYVKTRNAARKEKKRQDDLRKASTQLQQSAIDETDLLLNGPPPRTNPRESSTRRNTRGNNNGTG